MTIDLQALVDQAYLAGRYDRLDYSMELIPPLAAEDAAWAQALLKSAGKWTDRQQALHLRDHLW